MSREIEFYRCSKVHEKKHAYYSYVYIYHQNLEPMKTQVPKKNLGFQEKPRFLLFMVFTSFNKFDEFHELE